MLYLCAPVLAASPLAGTWRFDVVVHTRARVPLLGDALVETHKVMLNHIEEQPDGQLRARHLACGMFARSNRRLTETWFPPSFLEAMGDQSYGIEVGTQAEGTLSLRAEVDAVKLGWDPVLSGGSMPQKAGEAGVLDSDRDGRPGVTVWVRAPVFGTVEVSILQHSLTTIQGTLSDADTARGQARVTHLEQRVIGASNPLFRTNVPLEPVAEGSWFSLRRVPPDTTCASLEQVAPSEPGTPAAVQAGLGPR